MNSFLASHVTTLMDIDIGQLLRLLPKLPRLASVQGCLDIGDTESARALGHAPQLEALMCNVSSASVLQELVTSCSGVNQLSLYFDDNVCSEWLDCLAQPSAAKPRSLWISRMQFDTPLIVLARVPIIPCVRFLDLSDIDVLSLAGVSKMMYLETFYVGIGNASNPVDGIDELLECSSLRELQVIGFGEQHITLKKVLRQLVHSGQLSELGLMGWSNAEGTAFDTHITDEDIIELICHEGCRLRKIQVENNELLTERSVVAALQSPFLQHVFFENGLVTDSIRERVMELGLLDDINSTGIQCYF